MRQEYLSNEDVRRHLAESVKEAGNASRWAFENDFSRAFVSYVLNGGKAPSKRLLDILGLKEVKVYVRKEEANV